MPAKEVIAWMSLVVETRSIVVRYDDPLMKDGRLPPLSHPGDTEPTASDLEREDMMVHCWSKDDNLLCEPEVLRAQPGGTGAKEDLAREENAKLGFITLKDPENPAASVSENLGWRAEGNVERYFNFGCPNFIRFRWDNDGGDAAQHLKEKFTIETRNARLNPAKDKLLIRLVERDYRLVCVAKIPQPGEKAVAEHLFEQDGKAGRLDYEASNPQWTWKERGQYYLIYLKTFKEPTPNITPWGPLCPSAVLQEFLGWTDEDRNREQDSEGVRRPVIPHGLPIPVEPRANTLKRQAPDPAVTNPFKRIKRSKLDLSLSRTVVPAALNPDMGNERGQPDTAEPRAAVPAAFNPAMGNKRGKQMVEPRASNPTAFNLTTGNKRSGLNMAEPRAAIPANFNPAIGNECGEQRSVERRAVVPAALNPMGNERGRLDRPEPRAAKPVATKSSKRPRYGERDSVEPPAPQISASALRSINSVSLESPPRKFKEEEEEEEEEASNINSSHQDKKKKTRRGKRGGKRNKPRQNNPGPNTNGINRDAPRNRDPRRDGDS